MSELQDLVLHPTTRLNIEQFIASDSHALLLIGNKGSGKGSVLSALGNELGASRDEDRIYLKSDEASISINQARTLRSLLNLHQAHGKVLVVIIENAEKLTTEAQNALLKQLEEPADNIYFLLSTHDKNSLLPTVTSRLTQVSLNRVGDEALVEHFTLEGYESAKISRALSLSNNNVGLAKRVLNDEATDYIESITKAKRILSSNQCDKLLLIDVLVKDKPALSNLLSALERILETGFHNALQKRANMNVWTSRLKAIEESIEALKNNVSTRLILLRLMLQL